MHRCAGCWNWQGDKGLMEENEKLNQNIIFDVIIVGCGAAGCFAALHLPEELSVLMITKADLEESDSFLAQGGICVLKDAADYDSFYEDTMRAGHYENCPKAVEVMIRSSQETIQELIGYGVEFARDNGALAYTREGAHSTSRILYHEDITGREITSHLLARVREMKNVTLWTYTCMVDILRHEEQCEGILIQNMKGELQPIFARDVIWASGGIGGIYKNSTNYPHLTGDALAIALRRNIAVKNISYVQIHPTTLYTRRPGRRFLISESVRGEGALLYNKKGGERFVDELQPRDVVTKRILEQMETDKTSCVWLSMERIPREQILSHFPNIYRKCLEEGYDVTKEPIPVVPSQHYFMGGVAVDLNSRTSLAHLYSVGETSCNGVHGANRLASNSLLESLVFARRAAEALAAGRSRESADSRAKGQILSAYRGKQAAEKSVWSWELLQMRYEIYKKDYENMEQYAKINKERIWEEIRKGE